MTGEYCIVSQCCSVTFKERRKPCTKAKGLRRAPQLDKRTIRGSGACAPGSRRGLREYRSGVRRG